ncbi:VanZ family protein [Microbacterium stercoris]|uniref:VanZ family protein n=1 Tax=Microbacterium stercoris TaxID=2820289 RepID=A0A939QLB5_9MICO|nr:VanZ family protein [Microbacterium stercoris]MBO3665017.1 VanZ family protein [Microbacterium stercoris]
MTPGLPPMNPAIPYSPVVILPLMALVSILLLLRLRGRMTALRAFVALATAVYAVVAFAKVLLPFEIVIGSARDNLPPWTVFVELVPLSSWADDPAGIILNTLLFVPFGMLLPLVTRIRSYGRIVGAAALVSLGIEVVQLVLGVTISTGRIFEVDDLLANTLGGAIGALVYAVARRVPPLRRVIRAAEIPDRISPPPPRSSSERQQVETPDTFARPRAR